ncbi:MAG: FtsQ-type POTRA domain-containing protein [Candidatus Rokuibacteriota bacterium]|nr:MAG: FtsQ-type POTRA domain-containing protein [Candidatus Rokubacteria bacterium]
MSRGLISPRGRPPALGDLGDPATAVAGQRVPRVRRRPRRPIRWLRVTGGLALTVATAGAVVMAGHWALTTPRFAVMAVEVRGASRVPPQRILETSGIVRGTNLWRIDPDRVRARLESLPEIRRADVVRELPNRVSILVEERRPFTLVHAARLHWVDEDGRLLGEERHAVATEVPVIRGLSEDELVTMRTSPGPRARAAIALIRALLRTGSALAAEISEIDMSRPEGPVLYTIDGVEVRLGSEEWEERLARLEGVLAQVATQDVHGVDLRFRDQVVLKRGTLR